MNDTRPGFWVESLAFATPSELRFVIHQNPGLIYIQSSGKRP